MKKTRMLLLLVVVTLVISAQPCNAGNGLTGAWHAVQRYGRDEVPWIETIHLELNADGTGQIYIQMWDLAKNKKETTDLMLFDWRIEDDSILFIEKGAKDQQFSERYILEAETLFCMDNEFKRELVLPEEVGQINAFADYERVSMPASFEGTWYMMEHDKWYDQYIRYVEVTVKADGSGLYAAREVPKPDRSATEKTEHRSFTWYREGDVYYLEFENSKAGAIAITMEENACWVEYLGFLSRYPDALQAVVIGYDVPLYEHPDHNSRILYKIQHDESAVVLGRFGNFLQVFTINTDGYYDFGDHFVRWDSYGEGYLGFVDADTLALTRARVVFRDGGAGEYLPPLPIAVELIRDMTADLGPASTVTTSGSSDTTIMSESSSDDTVQSEENDDIDMLTSASDKIVLWIQARDCKVFQWGCSKGTHRLNASDNRRLISKDALTVNGITYSDIQHPNICENCNKTKQTVKGSYRYVTINCVWFSYCKLAKYFGLSAESKVPRIAEWKTKKTYKGYEVFCITPNKTWNSFLDKNSPTGEKLIDFISEHADGLRAGDIILFKDAAPHTFLIDYFDGTHFYYTDNGVTKEYGGATKEVLLAEAMGREPDQIEVYVKTPYDLANERKDYRLNYIVVFRPETNADSNL